MLVGTHFAHAGTRTTTRVPTAIRRDGFVPGDKSQVHELCESRIAARIRVQNGSSHRDRAGLLA
jgi:hypothetical protein